MTIEPSAADASSSPRLEVFWRPGCGFCHLLRTDLDRLGLEATWINIWEDEAAAEFVRSVNGGNEVVPTVRIGDEVRTNPSGQEVAELVEQA